MPKILKNKKIQSIIILSFGTVGAQVINFIGQLFITRIYLPQVLGEFTLIFSFVQLIVPISSLRMEMRLISAQSREEANNITTFSLLLNILIMILYYFFIIIIKLFNLNFYDNIGGYVYLIPLMIFTNSLRYLFISYSNFENEYRIIGKYQFIRELIFIALQIILGLIWPSTIVIVLSFFISPLIGIKEQGLNYFNSIEIGKEYKKGILIFKDNFIKFKNHILFQVPSQFANSLSYTIITLTIAKIANESDIAFYNFSVRILMIPLILISTNVSKIYMKELNSYLIKKKNFWKLHIQITRVLIIVSAFGFSLLYFIAPSLMGILFGENYTKAGLFISSLCVMYSIRFVTSSLVGAFIVFKKQEIDFFFQILISFVGLLLGIFAIKNSLTVENYLRYINVFYGLIYLINLVIINIMVKKNYGLKE